MLKHQESCVLKGDKLKQGRSGKMGSKLWHMGGGFNGFNGREAL